MTSFRFVVAIAVLSVLASACAGGGDTGGDGGSAAQVSIRQLWRWTAPPPSYLGMPEADAEGIAVTYGRHRLVLLDSTGQVRWTATNDGLRDVKPLLTEKLVVAPTETGLAGFERATGNPRWTAELGERANTPVAAGGLALTTTWEGTLAAVDVERGTVTWRARLPGGALGPAATDGRVVVATWEAEDLSSAGALALDAAGGRPRWDVRLEPGGVSAPAVSPEAGVAVVVAADLAAHGLALDTGEARWRTELEGAGSPEVPPMALSGGEVVIGHRLGGLALMNGSDGRVRWQASSDGAAVRGGPAGPGPDGRFALPLDDGRVLLAGADRPSEIVDPPGRVSGVAAGPGGSLLVATRETESDNWLSASSGW